MDSESKQMQGDGISPPTREQFGLTQRRADIFRKAHEINGWLFFAPIAVDFFGCLALHKFVFPNIDVPLLIFIFIALYPGFLLGNAIDERRKSKLLGAPDYADYVKYSEALKNYNEAVKNRHDLLRKIRRREFRNERKAEYQAKKAAEWWNGIDGKGFELGVAKVLSDKGYNVKHTGSSWGDEGVDIELKLDQKNIIIQCKAFSSYVSAGVVRELYGTLIHQKADEAWLIVTSGFYRGAKAFAHQKPIRLLTARQLMSLPAVQNR